MPTSPAAMSRCASSFWIQISLPKIIFCIPNIHPPVETPGLLVDVWSVKAAGQNHHLLPLNSEAVFDPCQAPFSYLTLHCLIFNKSSTLKRRTYQIFYLVQKIAVMQRKKDNWRQFSWRFCSTMVSCTKFEASSDKKRREHMLLKHDECEFSCNWGSHQNQICTMLIFVKSNSIIILLNSNSLSKCLSAIKRSLRLCVQGYPC